MPAHVVNQKLTRIITELIKHYQPLCKLDISLTLKVRNALHLENLIKILLHSFSFLGRGIKIFLPLYVMEFYMHGTNSVPNQKAGTCYLPSQQISVVYLFLK